MQSNHRIAIKLAEAISPDDVELAPLMIDSFLKGSRERQELLSRDKDGTLGSIGVPISVSDLPLIFSAISAMATAISTFFSPEVYPRIRRYVISSESKRPSIKENDFDKFLESFSNELATMGISKDKSEQIALRTIKILISDPDGLRFVKGLGADVNGE